MIALQLMQSTLIPLQYSIQPTAPSSPNPHTHTQGHDLTAAAPPPPGRPLRLLLAACGDWRNLLATVHGVVGRWQADAGMGAGEGAPAPLPRLHFTLNDGNVSMLARNAALLHLAVRQAAPTPVVLDVWGSHTLSTDAAALLRATLTELADKPWPCWLHAAMGLDGSEGDGDGAGSGAAGGAATASTTDGPSPPRACAAVETAIRAALSAWAHCSLTPPQLMAQRQAVGSEAWAVRLSVAAAETGARGPSASGAGGKEVASEVTEYVKSGSLVAGGEAVNPTFLLAPHLQCGAARGT